MKKDIKVVSNAEDIDIRDIVHIIELRDIENYVYKQLCREGRFADSQIQRIFDSRVENISNELKGNGYCVRASLGERNLLDIVRGYNL